MNGVTVCVPCYQQAEYLPECFASLRAQTLPPLEVIVVDDGTPDASVWQAFTGSNNDPGINAVRVDTRDLLPGVRMRYIRVTNRGLPNARNTGLMLARGRAFLPLDADDWIEPTYIEKTLPLLDDADVVLTGIQEHGVRNGTYLPGFDMPWDQVRVEHLHRQNRFYYASLFSTELLRCVGGWNGRRTEGYEDWSLWIDLLGHPCTRLAACLEPLFNYRTRHDSMLAQAERNKQAVIAGIYREHGLEHLL